MKVVGVIPVRLPSSRLPEKALCDIFGLPMILHTFHRACLADVLDEVVVATDSPQIKEVVEAVSGRVIMTSSEHQTGSDRIAEAATQLDADIIVNVQGDEPLLNPEHVDAVVRPLLEEPALQVAVLVTPYQRKNSPSDIKAVLDCHHNILYCSRADVPGEFRAAVDVLWKMSFIVPFRKDFLLQYAAWPQTPLEKIEYNEYLRILEHGVRLRAVPVEKAEISVDTPEDLKRVRDMMKTDTLKTRYMSQSLHARG